MIIQFPGESRKDSIVNYFSLDNMEEDQFFFYINNMGYTVDSDDDIIESLHEMWEEGKIY